MIQRLGLSGLRSWLGRSRIPTRTRTSPTKPATGTLDRTGAKITRTVLLALALALALALLSLGFTLGFTLVHLTARRRRQRRS